MDRAGPEARFAMDLCPQADKQRAEGIVQETLAGRDRGETWMVSLQKFHGGWDAFVEGPDPTVAAQMTEALRKAGFSR
jgi:hypothetical protein